MRLERRGEEDKYVVRREHYFFRQALWWSGSRSCLRRSSRPNGKRSTSGKAAGWGESLKASRKPRDDIDDRE